MQFARSAANGVVFLRRTESLEHFDAHMKPFVALTGITPDFVMPRSVMPLAGKICFKNNPDAGTAAETISFSFPTVESCSLARRTGLAQPTLRR